MRGKKDRAKQRQREIRHIPQPTRNTHELLKLAKMCLKKQRSVVPGSNQAWFLQCRDLLMCSLSVSNLTRNMEMRLATFGEWMSRTVRPRDGLVSMRVSGKKFLDLLDFFGSQAEKQPGLSKCLCLLETWKLTRNIN